MMAATASAQQIVNAYQEKNSIVVEYDLNAPADFVRLYVSLDGGETYRGPLKEVTGEVKSVPAGYDHKLVWEVLKEFETDAFECDQVRFRLSVKLKEKWYKETFITVNGAYSPFPQMSFGASVGQVKRFGWFVSVMTNGKFSGFNYDGECDENGYINGGYLPVYTEETSKMRLSVMAGGMARLTGPLCARVGVGYGNRTLRWEVVDGTWMKNEGYSVEGVDVSAGLQLNLKGFVVSAEVVTTQFKSIEGKVGLGFSLRN